MKSIIIVVLINLCLFVTIILNAANPNILLQKETSGNITLKIGLAVADNIQVDWGDGNLVTAAAGTTESTKDITGVVTGSKTIKLYGPITTVIVTDASLTAVDVSNAPGLRKLVVPRNKISWTDLTYNPVVYYVSVYNNNFDACALDDLFRSLPVVATGTVVFYNNPGALTSNSSIATNKGFHIGSGTVGDGTGCEISSELSIYVINDESIDASNVDPKFVDPLNGNYRLKEISPAINAGKNELLPVGIQTDIDGNERIVNNKVDLGCYETNNLSSDQIVKSTVGFEIYPNPVKNVLNIKFYGKYKHVELVDISGKMLFKKDVLSDEMQMQINVSNLNKGLYFLKLDSEVQKLIIH